MTPAPCPMRTASQHEDGTARPRDGSEGAALKTERLLRGKVSGETRQGHGSAGGQAGVVSAGLNVPVQLSPDIGPDTGGAGSGARRGSIHCKDV